MVAGGRELIDTLWNVNAHPAQDPENSSNGELIDTLWNVNDFGQTIAFGHNRINRYIMECKLRRKSSYRKSCNSN